MEEKLTESRRLRAIATAEHLSQKVEVVQLLDRLPDQILILNRDRRVVFCNEALLAYLGKEEVANVWGCLPGEILGCVHSGEEGGCGTTDHCMVCGALKSILKARKGGFAEEDCHILTKQGSPLELKVVGTPYNFEGEHLVFLTISDVSGENRRRLLERIFFHDLVNTASSIQGVSLLLDDASESEIPEYKQLLHDLCDDMIHDLRTQQILRAAETRELRVREEPIRLQAFLEELQSRFGRQEAFKGKSLKVVSIGRDFEVLSDLRLLRRVVENMIRNALEDSRDGEVVRMEFHYNADNGALPVRISINNARVMPRHVQLQIFNRSFSTKGSGRGIGTYSMKLLGESYLKGRVGFRCDPAFGTTFFIDLPERL
ncbi:MAG: histidine kinase [Verrucomicrobia bacterium]|jgi:PAS domain-containing protein|nr:histidine kinase [Verrucomicrobiota bacterium]